MPDRDRQPTTDSLQAQVDELRAKVDEIMRVMDAQNDPGGVGKPSLFGSKPGRGFTIGESAIGGPDKIGNG